MHLKYRILLILLEIFLNVILFFVIFMFKNLLILKVYYLFTLYIIIILKLTYKQNVLDNHFLLALFIIFIYQYNKNYFN